MLKILLSTFQNVHDNQCKWLLNVKNIIVEEKNVLYFGVNLILKYVQSNLRKWHHNK